MLQIYYHLHLALLASDVKYKLFALWVDAVDGQFSSAAERFPFQPDAALLSDLPIEHLEAVDQKPAEGFHGVVSLMEVVHIESHFLDVDAVLA